MRLCWADKVPLALLALITVALLLLGMPNSPDTSEYCRLMRLEHPDWTSRDSWCFVTSAEHWSAFLSIEGTVFWKIVLPAWIVPRLIDLFGGGPAIRREFRQKQRTKTYPDVHADIDLARNEWRSEPS